MHPRLGIVLLHLPGDRVHQVGLAEADAAIEEQRVERHRSAVGHAPRRGMGELVRLADDEILEGEARIERRPAPRGPRSRWQVPAPPPARAAPPGRPAAYRPRWTGRRRLDARSERWCGRSG